jgi:hypothetical protein
MSKQTVPPSVAVKWSRPFVNTSPSVRWLAALA